MLQSKFWHIFQTGTAPRGDRLTGDKMAQRNYCRSLQKLSSASKFLRLDLSLKEPKI